MSPLAEAVRTAVTRNATGGAVPSDPAADLLALGVLDSLALLGVVADLEKLFAGLLQPSDLAPENFSSLRSIEALLARRGAA